MNPLPLPAMTVESRVSITGHTVPVPDTTDVNLCNQLELTIVLNSEAKFKTPRWSPNTLKILRDTCKLLSPPTDAEIASSVRDVLHFDNWCDLSHWITLDACTEYWNMLIVYVTKNSIPEVIPSGFIDGRAVGYGKQYLDRLKITLEQCFDAKYFYNVPRPLEFARYSRDTDLSNIANAIHPGHPSYPAGHGTKFFTALEVINSVYILTPAHYRKLYIATHTAAMGRSGNLIHYPMDNDAGGYLTTLPEFNP